MSAIAELLSISLGRCVLFVGLHCRASLLARWFLTLLTVSTTTSSSSRLNYVILSVFTAQSYAVSCCPSVCLAVCLSVCLSVCPSVRLSDCLSDCLSRWCIVSRRLKIVKLLSQFGSPIIIVFDPQRCYLIPRPSAGAQSTRGWGNFRLKSPFISETVRDRSITWSIIVKER